MTCALCSAAGLLGGFALAGALILITDALRARRSKK